MKVNEFHGKHGFVFDNDATEGSAGSTDFLIQAIENADGVPFQLIFGPSVGDGCYLSLGSGIGQLLGIAAEDFTERVYYKMIEGIVPLVENMPEDPSETRRKFINGEIPAYRAEVLVMTPGGRRKWISDTSLPITDKETGKVVGAFGILTEIPGYRGSLKDAGQAGSRAEEYERLKKAFIRNISHEIRTPLNAIVGFSTLLCDQGCNAADRREYIEIITKNTDHLLKIITDIVEISKIEAGAVMAKKEVINLRLLLERARNHYTDEALRKGIVLSFSLVPADEEVFIMTDSSKLLNILENLIDNAVKFTAGGAIEFGCRVKDGLAGFFVSDTGPGIPPHEQEEVFSRFYRMDHMSLPDNGGLGLGLPVSKAYVEMLGGRIWFDRDTERGTKVRFIIPAE